MYTVQLASRLHTCTHTHTHTHTHTQIKKHQQKIEMVLSSKGYDVEYIDVAASEEAKKKMRDLSGNPKALPPQIFNDDQYCGVSRSTVITKHPQ